MCDALDAFDGALTAALGRWHLPIVPGQVERLRAHFQAVVKTNRVVNLTRITKPETAAVKHYADSLALLKWVDDRGIDVKTVLDIGTGAGFPSLPLAVMRPDWSVTAIDATGKKIDFLRHTASLIGLTNLHCVHAHSRHWYPGRFFQLVVFRALTTLSKALKESARHEAQDGWLVAYKSASMVCKEEDDSKTLTRKLRVRLHERYAYDLELQGNRIRRTLCVYRRC